MKKNINTQTKKAKTPEKTLLKKLPMKKNKVKRVSILRLATLLLACLFIIFSIYFASRESYSFLVNSANTVVEKYSSQRELSNINKLQKVEKVEIKNTFLTREEVIEKVTEYTRLPASEITLFVRIKDPEELKKISDAYSDVKKDDYLIAYEKVAILYDASSDKLINTIPLK